MFCFVDYISVVCGLIWTSLQFCQLGFDKEGICDTMELGVWEPVTSKINSMSAATEAACLVLSIDETVKNPASEDAKIHRGGPGGGMGRGMGGRGMPMSAAMGGGGMKAMMGGGRGRGIRAYRGKGGK